ncbi:MAG: hypothetical protein WDL87_05975 [Candidatus Omnitrophota bacterium]|jgi:hypothetical protein
MHLKFKKIFLFALLFGSLIFSKSSFADTVFLSNNSSADGIILSDQPDFIILFNKETYWRMLIQREYIVKIEKNDKGTQSREERKKKKKEEQNEEKE